MWRTCSPWCSRTSPPPGSGPGCLPGSGQGTACRGRCNAWPATPPAAGWPRAGGSSPGGRGSEQVVLGRGPVPGDPLHVDPRVAVQRPAALGHLLLGEQPRLDPLGQLDLLLGAEQRDLADLLQVVLDRVRGRARHRHLRGRKVVVVVAEDEDLLVLAAAIRGDLDHARAGRGFWAVRLAAAAPAGGRPTRLRPAVGAVRPVNLVAD